MLPTTPVELRARLSALSRFTDPAFADPLRRIATYLNHQAFVRLMMVDKSTREELRRARKADVNATEWRRTLERNTWIVVINGDDITAAVYDHARQRRRALVMQVDLPITYGDISALVESGLGDAPRITLRGADPDGPVDVSRRDYGFPPIGVWYTAPTTASKSKVGEVIRACVVETTADIHYVTDGQYIPNVEPVPALDHVRYETLRADTVVPGYIGTYFSKDRMELGIFNYCVTGRNPFECGVAEELMMPHWG